MNRQPKSARSLIRLHMYINATDVKWEVIRKMHLKEESKLQTSD